MSFVDEHLGEVSICESTDFSEESSDGFFYFFAEKFKAIS
jgi:hypothetical protein